ncbi:stress enhanced protein 2 chloroplastic [Tripterygium wilfordii]|uniref:Stress enhanced protein 2 chloroplastic n=1 Tax=Tripterygium wilfordii TaxID=458696 RepID=A0A7J7CUS7_TRIWF|nr:stress enhanced protein 2, chloroplastic [Tripterygium wilfordii]KAF5737882.1 stress enhanced protein 2 chloroplastic [Tripterygium wilfordii]
MATVARALRCELVVQKQSGKTEPAVSVPVQIPVPKKVRASEPDNGKIVLQPRLCTLRSYSSDRFGFVKTKRDGEDGVSRFFDTLSEYIESSKKSHDFEIISGRLAMIVFAATVTMEVATGNSVFRKMELQGIAEAAGVCLGAVTCAAIFAWFSSARNRVGNMFTISCNTFIDSLIDQIFDGLFYESEVSDWSDDI